MGQNLNDKTGISTYFTESLPEATGIEISFSFTSLVFTLNNVNSKTGSPYSSILIV